MSFSTKKISLVIAGAIGVTAVALLAQHQYNAINIKSVTHSNHYTYIVFDQRGIKRKIELYGSTSTSEELTYKQAKTIAECVSLGDPDFYQDLSSYTQCNVNGRWDIDYLKYRDGAFKFHSSGYLKENRCALSRSHAEMHWEPTFLDKLKKLLHL